jgi:hypothetical protein
MTTLLTPVSTPPNRALPQLRSEVSRLTHRRLYRVLALLLLAGIVVVSAVAFINASKSPDAPPEAQAAYEEALKNWQRDFDLNKQGWQACVDGLAAEESVELNCGPEPDLVRDGPRPEYFYSDPRYDATVNLPVVIVAVTMAVAALAFVLGASSGGAEWSSRSMTLQLLWEPRRFRLLSLKWLALGLVTAATAAVAMMLALTLGAVTAWLRGVADVADGAFDNGIYGELAGAAGRGVLLVVIAASFGYAIAMLVRNTGAALGTAFVYLLFVENALRIALIRFGSEAFMLTTSSVAFVVPGGVEVPGRQTQEQLADGFGTETTVVQLTNGRALLTVLVYLTVVAVPAVLSFTRRDVA